MKKIFHLFFLSLLFFCPLSFAASDSYIINSIKEGDEEAVEQLIKTGLDVNKSLSSEDLYDSPFRIPPDCYTPLMVAIKYGQINIVKNLINKGATVDATGYDGITQLTCAAIYGHTDIIMFLISEGHDIDGIALQERHTPLTCAIGNQQRDTIQLLIQQGANVNKSGFLFPPLMRAVLGDDIETIKLLIANNADVNVKFDGLGTTSLMYSSAKAESINITMFLVENGANVNAQSRCGETPLMFAARKGNISAVMYLLDHKAEVNTKSSAGNTALMYAAQGNNPAVVRYLLENGADVNIQNKKGCNALTCAMASENGLCNIMVLDNAHADFDMNNLANINALQYAFRRYKDNKEQEDNLVNLKTLVRFIEKIPEYSVKRYGKKKEQGLFICHENEDIFITDISVLKKLRLPCPLQEMAGSVIRKTISYADYNERIAGSNLPAHLINYLNEDALLLSFKCRMKLDDIIDRAENNEDS
ncbi:MAG: ankyrin repeat domain-containing protein [Endozoicomonadaceae bacterium]|nr:ankyrin repeat domain-containing protein [Endozoicomonadaceae bacterium]